MVIPTVVYTTDFEPVTVLSLRQDIIDTLTKQRKCILKTPEGMECRLMAASVVVPTHDGFSPRDIIVTLDEVEALALQPGWLSGQRSAVNLAISTIRKLKTELLKYLPKD